MQLPQKMIFKGINVLTTKQIAEAYGTEASIIRTNFNRNKGKYIEGKHYILLQGEELKQFKSEYEIRTKLIKTKVENQPFLKRARYIYLWTEKGALLHAKSINTDKAWEVYDYLVDFYFRVKESKDADKSKEHNGHTRTVVDIPVNAKAQEMIKTFRNNMTTIDSLLNMYNRYQSEENYEKVAFILKTIGIQIGDDLIAISQYKPNLIEKIY